MSWLSARNAAALARIERVYPAHGAQLESVARDPGDLGSTALVVSGLGILAFSPFGVAGFEEGEDYLAERRAIAEEVVPWALGRADPLAERVARRGAGPSEG